MLFLATEIGISTGQFVGYAAAIVASLAGVVGFVFRLLQGTQSKLQTHFETELTKTSERLDQCHESHNQTAVQLAEVRGQLKALTTEPGIVEIVKLAVHAVKDEEVKNRDIS